jgi:hypothetical protein
LYCLNKNLSEKGTTKLPGQPAFWFLIKQVLMFVFLIEVAKIFEIQKQKHESLTIYYLLDIKFKRHQKTINKLKIYRNKWFAHNDLDFILNPSKFLKENKLTPEKVANLCKETYKVLDEIKINYKLHSLGDITSQDAESSAKAIVDNLLKETSKIKI